MGAVYCLLVGAGEVISGKGDLGSKDKKKDSYREEEKTKGNGRDKERRKVN